MSTKTIVFWQTMVTPHMYELYKQLKCDGVQVKYIATCMLSDSREESGWGGYSQDKDDIFLIKDRVSAETIIDDLPDDAEHVCQGLRGNQLIREVQEVLSDKNIKYWVIIESLNFNGLIGCIRKIFYRIEALNRESELKGLLTIGDMPYSFFRKILPNLPVKRFSYFLLPPVNPVQIKNKPIRNFIFIGRLDKNKGLEIIFSALKKIRAVDFKFTFVGGGPLEKSMVKLAEKDRRVEFLGIVPQGEIYESLNDKDVLVILSKHDGWGAVVVEALMCGLHVIATPGVGSAYSLSGAPEVHIIPRRAVALARIIQFFSSDEYRATEVDYQLYRTKFSVETGANYLTSLLGLSESIIGESWSWN
jgi:glycosyltransferase involved in cell wall biosynthesis